MNAGRGSAEDVGRVAGELRSVLSADVPVRAACRELLLFENSSGRWHEMLRLPLPAEGVHAR